MQCTGAAAKVSQGTVDLINEGVDAATVSGALGHSTITTTVNTPYGHTPNRSHIRYKRQKLSDKYIAELLCVILPLSASNLLIRSSSTGIVVTYSLQEQFTLN